MPRRPTQPEPLSDQLREAVRSSGLTQKEIALATGIDTAALCRFVNGERGLLLPSVDALAAYLGVNLTAGPTEFSGRAGSKKGK